MIAQAVAFVVGAVLDLIILAALLRFWMQALRAPSRNPIAQFSMAITDFAVRPLRRVIPGLFRLDLASLVVAWVFELILQLVILWLFSASPFDNAGVIPVLVFLSFVVLARLTIYIFMAAIIIQAVLSWVGPRHPIAPFFEALTRPFLRPVQKVLPPIGGIDISPLVVFIFFQLVLMVPIPWLEGVAHQMAQRALL